MIPQLSAQNIGVQVWTDPNHNSRLLTKIYDIEVGKGSRMVLHYKWSVAVKDSGFSISQSKKAPRDWHSIRKPLLKALENHIGCFGRHGYLMTLSPPSPHALYPAFEALERMFVYDTGINEGHYVSVVLDDSTVISPAPAAVIESDRVLSLATIAWQWWQQEQDSRSEASESTTLIRIMYVY